MSTAKSSLSGVTSLPVRRPLQRGAHVFIAMREAEQRWTDCGVDPPLSPELLKGLRELRESNSHNPPPLELPSSPSSRHVSPSHTPPPIETTPTPFIPFPQISPSPPSSPTPHRASPPPENPAAHFTYPPTLSGPWLDTLLSSLHAGCLSLRTALAETQAELRLALESVTKAHIEVQEEREEWDGFVSYLRETMGPYWAGVLRTLGARPGRGPTCEGGENVDQDEGNSPNLTHSSYQTPPRPYHERSMSPDVERSVRASRSPHNSHDDNDEDDAQDPTNPLVGSKRSRTTEEEEDEEEEEDVDRSIRVSLSSHNFNEDEARDPTTPPVASKRSRSSEEDDEDVERSRRKRARRVSDPEPEPESRGSPNIDINLKPSTDDTFFPYTAPPGIKLFPSPPPNDDEDDYSYPFPPPLDFVSPLSPGPSIGTSLPPPFPPPRNAQALPKRRGPAPLRRTYQMRVVSPSGRMGSGERIG